MKTDGRRLHGTYTLQPPANAGCFARVEVFGEGRDAARRLKKQGSGTARWHITSSWEDISSEHDAQPYRRLLPLEQDTQRWLDLIRQEEIAVAQAANPEKVNHVMEEKDLPINASGLQTLDNIWGLFETAVELNSAAGRREMYALARELSECQNLTDWIIKSQTENEGAQAPMACTQN